MKAIFNNPIDIMNFTLGKEYDVKPCPIKGFVSIYDDNGSEQLVLYGSDMFVWKEE